MEQQTITIISSRDIERCISMRQAIAAMKEAFRAVSARETIMPLRTSLAVEEHDGVALFMPAYLPSCGQLGLKTVMTYRNNGAKGLPAIHALVQLFDGTTGQPLALIDGEHLTALRTGAASGLATELLAVAEADTVAIIGAGVQGRTQLEAVCCARRIARAYVIDRSKAATDLFAAEMGPRLGIEVLPGTLANLREADIVCTATSARSPLFLPEMVKSGAHLNAIGAFRPDMCEIPPETVQRARVFVDQYAACRKEAGDLIQPLEAGIIDDSHIRCELGELLLETGRNKGRQTTAEVTLFKSVGLAAQDLVVASRIYQTAKASGIGTEVQL